MQNQRTRQSSPWPMHICAALLSKRHRGKRHSRCLSMCSRTWISSPSASEMSEPALSFAPALQRLSSLSARFKRATAGRCCVVHFSHGLDGPAAPPGTAGGRELWKPLGVGWFQNCERTFRQRAAT